MYANDFLWIAILIVFLEFYLKAYSKKNNVKYLFHGIMALPDSHHMIQSLTSWYALVLINACTLTCIILLPYTNNISVQFVTFCCRLELLHTPQSVTTTAGALDDSFTYRLNNIVPPARPPTVAVLPDHDVPVCCQRPDAVCRLL